MESWSKFGMNMTSFLRYDEYEEYLVQLHLFSDKYWFECDFNHDKSTEKQQQNN